ncbi:MAG: hypothetical protein AAGH88_09870 [Planctomycetota bacterium]
MTSKQVWLILAVLLVALAIPPGCGPRPTEYTMLAPYGARQVWAVVPLRNESGSGFADGYRFADELAVVFEKVEGIDVLSVNRVIQAMQGLEMQAVRSREDAIKLREVLGVDALVVGTVTSYEPYDPMRVGMALDLYASASNGEPQGFDIRGMSWTPTADGAGMQQQTLYRHDQPVTTVSAVFGASSPLVRDRLDEFAYGRGTSGNWAHDRRLYTLNMNLFIEFVSHEMGSHLVWAEWKRFARAYQAELREQQAANPPAP